jgi:hypothetical protein
VIAVAGVVGALEPQQRLAARDVIDAHGDEAKWD